MIIIILVSFHYYPKKQPRVSLKCIKGAIVDLHSKVIKYQSVPFYRQLPPTQNICIWRPRNETHRSTILTVLLHFWSFLETTDKEGSPDS